MEGGVRFSHRLAVPNVMCEHARRVPARVAFIQVRTTRATLQPKMKGPFVKSCEIQGITTTVRMVEGVNAPKGVTLIC
jgi:hypothetical protein